MKALWRVIHQPKKSHAAFSPRARVFFIRRRTIRRCEWSRAELAKIHDIENNPAQICACHSLHRVVTE
jgi:hypothetical protein